VIHRTPEPARLALLLGFVLVSFAANSLITRHVVAAELLDPGLLSAVRVVAAALALLVFTLVRGGRVVVGRRNVMPTLALGAYAVCISYGYRFIGAAAGTFIFYAVVMLTLLGWDLVRRVPLAPRRRLGALVSLAGITVLTSGRVGAVTVTGVLLLALTGAAWGAYTAAGRAAGDPTTATAGNFVLLAVAMLPAGLIGWSAGLRVSTPGLLWAMGMGAGTTAFAYVAWYACQRSMTGTAAGSAQLVIPVITTFGAVALLGERMSWALVAAALLVAAGMWLNRPGRTPGSSPR